MECAQINFELETFSVCDTRRKENRSAFAFEFSKSQLLLEPMTVVVRDTFV